MVLPSLWETLQDRSSFLIGMVWASDLASKATQTQWYLIIFWEVGPVFSVVVNWMDSNRHILERDRWIGFFKELTNTYCGIGRGILFKFYAKFKC